MAIRLLTLDLDNTLWETDPVIRNAENILKKWIQAHRPEATEIYSRDTLFALRKCIAKERPDILHKTSELRREILYRVFLQAKLSEKIARDSSEAAFTVFLKARNQVELYDGTIPVLTKLSNEFPLIAVSNGNSDLSVIGLNHFFKAHFSADHSPRPKPYPDMFEQALRYTGVSAEECIHIGDHPKEDIIAAQALGMKTVWVNTRGKEWEITEGKPDAEITSLHGLPSVIHALAH